MVCPAVYPEGMAQIGGSNEQDIDTVRRCDGIDVGQRVTAFDLDAARHLRIGIAQVGHFAYSTATRG